MLEKVPLSKEDRERLGSEYAVTPVRKFGVRPSTHSNLDVLEEVGYLVPYIESILGIQF